MTYDVAAEQALASLPPRWRIHTFRRVSRLVTDTRGSRELPLLSLSSNGVVAPRVEEGGLGRQAPSETTMARYWACRPGNLVVNPMWLAGGGIGVSAVDGAVSPDYRVYEFNTELHPRYAHHLLRSKPYRDQYRLYMRADTTFDRRVTKEDFHNMPIPVPPIDEQRQIADFLDAETACIDSLLSLRRQQSELLVEYMTAQISQICTVGDGLRTVETGNVWVPKIHADWELLPLKRRWQITDCKHRTPAYVDSGFPVVSPGDIRPGRLDLSHAHRFVTPEDFRDLADGPRRPQRGDIVYSRNASVGIAAYVDTDEPFTMGQDVCKISSRDQNQLFLTYYLNSVALNELAAIQVGCTFTRVNIATLLDLQIACPPRAIQDELASEMDRISESHESAQRVLNRNIDLLLERKQALITAAVTGQFDVTTARGVDLS